ncbi:MAG: hypothetical protein U9R06_02605 [Patescibacteria group bacterium]|nr:hypothetical protein [Patescibacteria group bacterium]
MDERKELILNTIIKEHIKTGAPVGSGVLVKNYKLNISPATVRNEMISLEEEGYIVQPHTSAGRIPTERAYRSYLENIKEVKLGNKEAANLEKVFKKNDEISFKGAAKILSQISGNAVFWAFHKHNLYYTGISNLLQQPEFRELDLLYGISAIIDRMDEVIADLFDSIGAEPQILLGSENPFGDFCGTVFVKYQANDKIGLFGILGPIRMDYAKDLSLIKFINNKLLQA